MLHRTDPFVLSLAQADAAQACVGGFGLAPTAGTWSVLTQLPWVWPPLAPERVRTMQDGRQGLLRAILGELAEDARLQMADVLQRALQRK